MSTIICDNRNMTMQGRGGHRGSSRQRGYTRQWDKARLQHLNEHPLCVICSAAGRITQATEVDHIKAHHGDMALFWDVTNWQSLCRPCHEGKSSAEQTGHGSTGIDGWPIG